MSFKPNPSLLRQLMDMGYSKNCSTRALFNTGNCDIASSVEWIIDHQGDPDVEIPLSGSSGGQSQPPSRGGSRGRRDEEDDLPPEIAAMQAYLDETDFYKMVIVVNTELTMGTGKVSAQVAQAAIGTFKEMSRQSRRWGESQLQWEQFGQQPLLGLFHSRFTTVLLIALLDTVEGRNPQHLMDLEYKAERIGCCHFLVKDEDKTEVTPGSITALGLFGKNNVIDQVTEDLPIMD